MSAPWGQGPIVLIEDEENDVSFARESLSAARIGNPLIVFNDPGAAQRELRSRLADPPVLFILDVGFQGGMTGLDFLRWVRAQPEPFGSTPAMMFTGSIQPLDYVESMNLNALHVLKKPATAASLVRAVQALGFVVVTSLPSGELGIRIIQRGDRTSEPENP